MGKKKIRLSSGEKPSQYKNRLKSRSARTTLWCWERVKRARFRVNISSQRTRYPSYTQKIIWKNKRAIHVTYRESESCGRVHQITKFRHSDHFTTYSYSICAGKSLARHTYYGQRSLYQVQTSSSIINNI